MGLTAKERYRDELTLKRTRAQKDLVFVDSVPEEVLAADPELAERYAKVRKLIEEKIMACDWLMGKIQ